MVKLLSNIFKKDLSFESQKDQHRPFEDLKKTFLSVPMLKFLNFTKPFEVHIDAHNFAIERVFMQYGHLIAFESNKSCGVQL